MITDPLFYLVAVPAILLVGLAKGGMGGGLGMVAVPLMALAVPASQAAAILLPILCLMDLVALWGFRGRYHRPSLVILLPAALVGVVLGAFTYRLFDEAQIKLLVAALALGFCLYALVRRFSALGPVEPGDRPWRGRLLGLLGGFTSFSIHAGGPPVEVYLLPRRLDRTRFVGTTVILFTAINFSKLVPYAWLGLLDSRNLATSLVLLGLAPLGVYAGIYLHRRISDGWFYGLCYLLLSAAGLKLGAEGFAAL